MQKRNLKQGAVYFLGLVCLFAASSNAFGAIVPSGFTDSVFISGLSSPTAMEFAPDGRLFICEQGGRLRVVKNGALLATPFVTLSVDPNGERGLLGVAFDPNFATNQYVYVYYTVLTSPRHNRVARFTANGDVSLAGSQVDILELDNLSSATNHNGGAIHFGADGKLYVAVGDNALAENAQSLGNRLGKILRINPDGTIPADNPASFPGITGTTSGVNKSIWAVGLRNPFTSSFQRTTGKFFINDVGQSTWEEIDVGIKGKNYGWPATEGPTTDPNFAGPIYAYSHSGFDPSGCAITGGAFYNPVTAKFPSSYVGKYFFSDYCGNWIYHIDAANPSTATQFATGISAPVDLKIGPDGALYYLVRGTNSVGRITYSNITEQKIIPSTGLLNVNEEGSGTFTVKLARQPSSSLTVSVQTPIVNSTLQEQYLNQCPAASATPIVSGTTQIIRAVCNKDSLPIIETPFSAGIELRITGTNLCLYAPTGGRGTRIRLASCNSSKNQLWTAIDRGSNMRSFKSVATGWCLDVSRSTGFFQEWTCGTSLEQKFMTIGIPSPSPVSFSPATLSFTTTNWNTQKTVTVSAVQDTDVIDSGATLLLSATALASEKVVVTAIDNDRPAGFPRATITRPLNGDVVKGVNAEFFGDGIDKDGQVVKAYFFVDSVLKYTDVNTHGHYHYGGDHNLWNTTGLTNGPHTLRMNVVDNRGNVASHQITVTVSN